MARQQRWYKVEWWNETVECCFFLRHVHDTKADRKTADNHDSSSLVFVLQYRLVHQSRPKPINPKDEAPTHQFCTQVLRGILMRLVECAR